MILKDLIYIVWNISPSVPHYPHMPPSVPLRDENFNNTYVSRKAQASCHLVAPFILNKHIHPFGISNPKYHCYMNHMIQLLFSILRNSSTEDSLVKFIFESTHSASSSTDVDTPKFRLVQHDNIYGGQKSVGCFGRSHDANKTFQYWLNTLLWF